MTHIPTARSGRKVRRSVEKAERRIYDGPAGVPLLRIRRGSSNVTGLANRDVPYATCRTAAPQSTVDGVLETVSPRPFPEEYIGCIPREEMT